MLLSARYDFSLNKAAWDDKEPSNASIVDDGQASNDPEESSPSTPVKILIDGTPSSISNPFHGEVTRSIPQQKSGLVCSPIEVVTLQISKEPPIRQLFGSAPSLDDEKENEEEGAEVAEPESQIIEQVEIEAIRLFSAGSENGGEESQQDHEGIEDGEPTPSKVPRFTLKDVASIGPFLKQKETERGGSDEKVLDGVMSNWNMTADESQSQSSGEKVPPSDEEELQGFKRKRDTAPDEEIHDGVMTSNSNVAANDESQSKGEKLSPSDEDVLLLVEEFTTGKDLLGIGEVLRTSGIRLSQETDEEEVKKLLECNRSLLEEEALSPPNEEDRKRKDRITTKKKAKRRRAIDLLGIKTSTSSEESSGRGPAGRSLRPRFRQISRLTPL